PYSARVNRISAGVHCTDDHRPGFPLLIASQPGIPNGLLSGGWACERRALRKGSIVKLERTPRRWAGPADPDAQSEGDAGAVRPASPSLRASGSCVNGHSLAMSPGLFRTAGSTPAFEVKFLLNEADAAEIERRLRERLTSDPHADGNGMYPLSRLYFDDPRLAV